MSEQVTVVHVGSHAVTLSVFPFASVSIASHYPSGLVLLSNQQLNCREWNAIYGNQVRLSGETFTGLYGYQFNRSLSRQLPIIDLVSGSIDVAMTEDQSPLAPILIATEKDLVIRTKSVTSTKLRPNVGRTFSVRQIEGLPFYLPLPLYRLQYRDR